MIKRNEKGQIIKGSGSLNPGGRPKAEREIRELIRQGGPALIARLFELSASDNASDAVAAIRVLLAYGYGRPVETHRIEGELAAVQKHVVLHDSPRPADA